MNIHKTLANKKVKITLLTSAILIFWLQSMLMAIPTVKYVKAGQFGAAIMMGVIPFIFYAGLALLALWIILRDFHIKKGTKKNKKNTNIGSDSVYGSWND